MSIRFYTNCDLALGTTHLQGSEAHHLATVLRANVGDEICLFNGDGNEYPSRVVKLSKKSVSLDVLDIQSICRELPFAIRIAAALPKGDRLQFMIEKLTEIGAAEFIPLTTQREVVKSHPGKMEKMQRWVIEASKQCGRNKLMRINEPLSLADLDQLLGECVCKVMAHPYTDKCARDLLSEWKTSPTAICIAVGPEGGFTDEETAEAESLGWTMMQLGKSTLRIETAAIAATVEMAIRLRARSE